MTTLTNWVNGGGNLIALRPDKQLAGLLGLTDAGLDASNAYLQVDTTTAAGRGHRRPDDPVPRHGRPLHAQRRHGDRDALLERDHGDANPAVTLRSVGANGGQAAAFTFDLNRSIVYTRQGNPAWAGQDRDGVGGIRPNDLFYGAKAGDVAAGLARHEQDRHPAGRRAAAAAREPHRP